MLQEYPHVQVMLSAVQCFGISLSVSVWHEPVRDEPGLEFEPARVVPTKTVDIRAREDG